MLISIRAVCVAGAILGACLALRAPFAQSERSPATITRSAHVRIDLIALTMRPAVQAVQVGDTVTWTNRDIVPHTVTAHNGAFDSKLLAAQASWTHVLTRADLGGYHCRYHPNMKGTLGMPVSAPRRRSAVAS